MKERVSIAGVLSIPFLVNLRKVGGGSLLANLVDKYVLQQLKEFGSKY